MYEEIKEQFARVIRYSQDFYPRVDTLFEQWYEAKQKIIEAFGGQLIVEIPGTMHFHLDDKDRKKHFDEFVYEISSVYHNDELAHFLNKNVDGFYENSVHYAYEAGDIKIPKGMKLVKAFKFFEKDEKLLAQFQSSASQIIQENKVEGTLCFSVHPLDFLTTSVNTYNWRSCHALDGEFRAGNLSYMLDKTTVICYLKGADNVKLPMLPDSVPWNSKKWRVLLFLSKNWDMIFAGRQYPFSSKPGLDIALSEFVKLVGKDEVFSPWEDDYVTYFTRKDGQKYNLNTQYVPIKGELHDLCSIVKDGKQSMHFNDLLRSSTYHNPYYSIRDHYFWWSGPDETPHFTIGKKVPCLCCGENFLETPEMMVCMSCAEDLGLIENDNYSTCDCCGARIYEGDGVWVCDEYLCMGCYETECFTCDICGETYFTCDQHYDRSRDAYICTDCYKRKDED